MGPPTQLSSSKSINSLLKLQEGTRMSWKITCQSAFRRQQEPGSWGSPHDRFIHGLTCVDSSSTTSKPLVSDQESSGT
jgi:hypothetical protein